MMLAMEFNKSLQTKIEKMMVCVAHVNLEVHILVLEIYFCFPIEWFIS